MKSWFHDAIIQQVRAEMKNLNPKICLEFRANDIEKLSWFDKLTMTSHPELVEG
jgi:hypothetical protein